MAAQRIRLGVVGVMLLVGPAVAAQPGPGTPLPPPPQTSLGAGAPTAVLTAPAGMPAVSHAPAAEPGLWCGDTPAGCCGPVGANGPVTYELYARTGPSFVIGGGNVFDGALKFGWNVTGGGRSLFFNQAGDSAWYLDLGLGYTYTRGADRVINVFSPRETVSDPNDPNFGQPAGPDEIHPFRVRALHRTTFNYALGRFWWLNGPGHVCAEADWNSRVGLDVGGRWGTNHVDLEPVADPTNYLRRSGISHGIYVGANWDWERSMGAWILFGGLRAEWGHNWMNLVPPQDGNIQDINAMLTLGVRF
ncbi:MAG TPA: hypothetical protein VM533_14380 [Fimbriiglobus sp.]|nr:hypothetical protein [Fimbriiglobus sp.]